MSPLEQTAQADPFADVVQDVVTFMDGYSIEATRPDGADIDALSQSMPQGSRVYLSAVPRLTFDELVARSRSLRDAGLEPVPHLAAREFESTAALANQVARLHREANVRCALVIAGDRAQPAGPFASSSDVIGTSVLADNGITEIGIAGYPDGHPRVPDHDLHRLMMAKIAAAEETGLRIHIVTQFGFDAGAIATWMDRLRDDGIDHPVRVGLAGPTRMTALLKYAQRCGVKASAQSMTRAGGLAKHLIGGTAPDALIRELASAARTGRLGEVRAHFFSFGGVGHTARWAGSAARGRIALDHHTGFSITG